MPEVRRLLLALGEDDEWQPFRLGWSRWRRAHQALAQRCHIARHARERDGHRLLASTPLGRMPVAHGELTEAEWARVRPLLPPQRPPVGRPRHDHRTVLGGILWVLRTCAPWREMPARFGKWDTAYSRYRLWREQGIWQRIIETLGPPAPPPPQRSSSGAAA